MHCCVADGIIASSSLVWLGQCWVVMGWRRVWKRCCWFPLLRRLSSLSPAGIGRAVGGEHSGGTVTGLRGLCLQWAVMTNWPYKNIQWLHAANIPPGEQITSWIVYHCIKCPPLTRHTEGVVCWAMLVLTLRWCTDRDSLFPTNYKSLTVCESCCKCYPFIIFGCRSHGHPTHTAAGMSGLSWDGVWLAWCDLTLTIRYDWVKF